MNSKDLWQKLAARFNGYSRRERAFVGGALVGGILLLGFNLLVDPNLVLAARAKRQSAQQQADAGSMNAQLQVLRSQLQLDPDAGKKAELVGLKADLANVEAALRKLEGGLVPPGQMNAVLERLLAANTRLRLVSLKSLPPVNLADAGKVAEAVAVGAEAKVSPARALGLYKHGVEVRLEGGYSDLHQWLAQVEASQQRLLWGDVHFQVLEHPNAVMSLTIFTLSTDQAWLSI